MPTASSDFRPSMTGSVATPIVIPLTSRMTIWSAPDCIPASRSTSARRMPCQRALPMYPPPTASETQVRVTSCSTMGRWMSSSNVRVAGLSTMPWMRSSQVFAATCGTIRAVSTR